MQEENMDEAGKNWEHERSRFFNGCEHGIKGEIYSAYLCVFSTLYPLRCTEKWDLIDAHIRLLRKIPISYNKQINYLIDNAAFRNCLVSKNVDQTK